MAAEEHTVKIKTTADLSGTDKAAQGLGDVEKKAKSSFASIGEGVTKAKTAMSRLRNAINMVASIGFLKGSFDAVIALFEKFTERERKAKEEALALAAAEKEATDKKRVEALASAYQKLTAEIADAAKARERANELDDMQRSAEDKLEDDTAELKMREDVAALDENDPLYERKKEQIEARYETEKLRRSVSRQQRDANISAERTWQERDATIEESTEKQFSLISDREELERLKRERDKKYNASKQLNENDNFTFGQRFTENLKALFTLDTSRFNRATSEKGDEQRKREGEEAAALDEKVKAKRKEIKAKEKEIADLETTAAHLSKKAGIQGNIAINAGVATAAAEVSAKTTVNKADKAVTDEEQRYADAAAAQETLRRQKAEVEARIRAEQAKKAAAGRTVYEAEGDLEVAKLAGKKKDAVAANERLKEAQNAAQEVDLAADKAINALTKALNSISGKLKLADRVIERNLKLQESYRADVPGA